MAEPDTFWVKLHLDPLFRAVMDLDTDQERSGFLIGLTRGLNAGALREGVAECHKRGYLLGRDARDKADSYREQARISGGKRNPKAPPEGASEGGSEGASEGGSEGASEGHSMGDTRVLVNSSLLSSDCSLGGQGKEKKPSPTKGKKAKEPSVAEILGDEVMVRRYWKTAQCWPQNRNPKPRTTARLYAEAMRKAEDIDMEQRLVYSAAETYREQHLPPHRKTDETQFMLSFEKWLQEEGWMTVLAEFGEGWRQEVLSDRMNPVEDLKQERQEDPEIAFFDDLLDSIPEANPDGTPTIRVGTRLELLDCWVGLRRDYRVTFEELREAFMCLVESERQAGIPKFTSPHRVFMALGSWKPFLAEARVRIAQARALEAEAS